MRKILIGILLGLSLGISFSLFAWVNPSQNPPSGGGVLQTSNTGLTINTSTYFISGNVGIGTAAPDHKLTISSSASGASVQANIFNPTAGAGQVAGIRFHTASGWNVMLRTNQNTAWLELTDANGNWVHRWNGGDYYATGNVGIGTTNPGGYRLYVNGSLYASSYYCASDIRLKRDIQEINGTLEKIMNLHPISFVWNEKSEKAGKKDIGISGQEIEKYFPELVFKNDDGYISVDYSKLSVVAISAIKEQQKIIEEQAQKIKILEEKIKELESKIEKR